jgi:hypothetical protein
MAWNPEDFGGLQSTQLIYEDFWKPDIFLFNSAEK